MPSILLELAIAGALSAYLGPVPADRTTNKPSEAACAAARAQGRTLPGCNDASPAPPTDGEIDSADPAPPTRGPRDRFMVCPQDPRCPR